MVSEGTWLVIRKSYQKTKSWVSRFGYVRRVVIDPTTHVCKCSCLFHERHGIPCRHVYVFLKEVRTTDFDVRWWVTYGSYYGEKGIPSHQNPYTHRLHNLNPYSTPNPKGHEAFTSEVDHIRAYGDRGPIYHMGEENYPVGFIIGLETTDNRNQVADLIC